MITIKTKAGMDPLPVYHFKVSTAQLVQYLQNELGFPIDCDFRLHDNRAEFEKPLHPEKTYVLMRAIFKPEDITINAKSDNFIDRHLRAAGAGAQFKSDVIEVLKPFMYDPNTADLRNFPEEIARLQQQGLYGRALEDLMTRPTFFYDSTNNMWGTYLKPEAIIQDMLKNPDTDQPNGAIGIGFVSADNNAQTLSWGINVYCDPHFNANGHVTVPDVFNGVKAN